MSHFSVLVVTDVQPTEAALKPILQPWHEYECTGVKDQYVIQVDVTAEAKEQWERKVKIIRLPDGTIKSRWSNDFYTGEPEDEMDRRLGRKSFVMPEGGVEDEIPQFQLSKIEGESFAKFCKDYGGWKVKGDKVFSLTNPNKKWDWWQIGGRFSGQLSVKAGAFAGTGKRSWTNEKDVIVGCDVAKRSDLDLDAMKKAQQDRRRKWAENCCAEAKRTMEDLDIACRVKPIAHAKWMELPEPKPRGADYAAWLRANGGPDWGIYADFSQACWEIPAPSPNQSLTEWIEAAPPISTFAVVHDNQWFEKGDMGWWGMVSDEKPNWDEHFTDLFGLIRDDQWVAIVDCHI